MAKETKAAVTPRRKSIQGLHKPCHLFSRKLTNAFGQNTYFNISNEQNFTDAFEKLIPDINDPFQFNRLDKRYLDIVHETEEKPTELANVITRTVVMHRTEPTAQQKLALQLAEKLGSLVENNERVFDHKQGTYGGYFRDQKDGYRKNEGYMRRGGYRQQHYPLRGIIIITFIIIVSTIILSKPYPKQADTEKLRAVIKREMIDQLGRHQLGKTGHHAPREDKEEVQDQAVTANLSRYLGIKVMQGVGYTLTFDSIRNATPYSVQLFSFGYNLSDTTISPNARAKGIKIPLSYNSHLVTLELLSETVTPLVFSVGIDATSSLFFLQGIQLNPTPYSIRNSTFKACNGSLRVFKPPLAISLRTILRKMFKSQMHLPSTFSKFGWVQAFQWKQKWYDSKEAPMTNPFYLATVTVFTPLDQKGLMLPNDDDDNDDNDNYQLSIHIGIAVMVFNRHNNFPKPCTNFQGTASAERSRNARDPTLKSKAASWKEKEEKQRREEEEAKARAQELVNHTRSKVRSLQSTKTGRSTYEF
ncbi:hypothetical protein EI555_018366, partial [Monodon monoceros]